jgi:hypothetical protein
MQSEQRRNQTMPRMRTVSLPPMHSQVSEEPGLQSGLCLAGPASTAQQRRILLPAISHLFDQSCHGSRGHGNASAQYHPFVASPHNRNKYVSKLLTLSAPQRAGMAIRTQTHLAEACMALILEFKSKKFPVRNTKAAATPETGLVVFFTGVRYERMVAPEAVGEVNRRKPPNRQSQVRSRPIEATA